MSELEDGTQSSSIFTYASKFTRETGLIFLEKLNLAHMWSTWNYIPSIWNTSVFHPPVCVRLPPEHYTLCPKALERAANLPVTLKPELLSLNEISEQERLLLKDSWACVKNDLYTHGALIFIQYFKRFADQRIIYYPEFSDCPSQCLVYNNDFLEYTHDFMMFINEFLRLLKSRYQATKYLYELGKTFAGRDLNKSHFKNFQKTLVNYIRNEMREDYTPGVKAAWVKATDIMVNILDDASKWDSEL